MSQKRRVLVVEGRVRTLEILDLPFVSTYRSFESRFSFLHSITSVVPSPCSHRNSGLLCLLTCVEECECRSVNLTGSSKGTGTERTPNSGSLKFLSPFSGVFCP